MSVTISTILENLLRFEVDRSTWGEHSILVFEDWMRGSLASIETRDEKYSAIRNRLNMVIERKFQDRTKWLRTNIALAERQHQQRKANFYARMLKDIENTPHEIDRAQTAQAL